MTEIDIFPTKIYSNVCALDLISLEEEIYNHAKNNSNVLLSNVGGYQGHEYSNQELINEIANTLPQADNKPLKEFKSTMWVNINKTGDYNEIHDHNPYDGTALSGVFYVKTPANCGRIRFYDPRPFITKAPDMQYYNDGNTYHYFDPEPNMLLIFPAWLKHMVEPNKSNEDRISISFNIKLLY